MCILHVKRTIFYGKTTWTCAHQVFGLSIGTECLPSQHTGCCCFCLLCVVQGSALSLSLTYIKHNLHALCIGDLCYTCCCSHWATHKLFPFQRSFSHIQHSIAQHLCSTAAANCPSNPHTIVLFILLAHSLFVLQSQFYFSFDQCQLFQNVPTALTCLLSHIQGFGHKAMTIGDAIYASQTVRSSKKDTHTPYYTCQTTILLCLNTLTYQQTFLSVLQTPF